MSRRRKKINHQQPSRARKETYFHNNDDWSEKKQETSLRPKSWLLDVRDSFFLWGVNWNFLVWNMCFFVLPKHLWFFFCGHNMCERKKITETFGKQQQKNTVFCKPSHWKAFWSTNSTFNFNLENRKSKLVYLVGPYYISHFPANCLFFYWNFLFVCSCFMEEIIRTKKTLEILIKLSWFVWCVCWWWILKTWLKFNIQMQEGRKQNKKIIFWLKLVNFFSCKMVFFCWNKQQKTLLRI